MTAGSFSAGCLKGRIVRRTNVGMRLFSEEIRPILNTEHLQQRLQALIPSVSSSLKSRGFWTNFERHKIEPVLPTADVMAMRDQSIALRKGGRFVQSWSERIDESTGARTVFDKKGVFACEPDGQDYYTAPDLLLYMTTVISNLPPLLNHAMNSTGHSLNLSNQSFNAKLAVTSPGGSTYPLHVDNTLGVTGSPHDDCRKLTCILYLNPDYEEGDGGELRLLLLNGGCLDLDPRGGRMVIFWSDEIPHEVLPCKPDSEDEMFDRYALTIWLPDIDPRNIQSKGSKFESLRVGAFATETWC
jgi:2OG-Fe(II) oxygenase superfamily